MAPLADLRSLTSLYLSGDRISDLSALAGMRSLTWLRVRGDAILDDLSALAGLRSLTSLSLRGHAISDVAPLAGLSSLMDLYLDRNRISDLSPLAGLSALEYLALSSNAISDLAPLAGLSSLEHLGLRSNAISNVAPLANLSSLRYLDLGYNAFWDVAPLAGLASLTDLRLHSNEIAELRPLGPLPRLRSLYLSRNRLRTLPPGLFVDVGDPRGQTIFSNDGTRGPVRGLTDLVLDGNPGAPFRLALQPVLASAPYERPAHVAVQLAEGAPLVLNVGLEAVGGSLAADVATVAPGALRSEVLAVWPAGRGPVVVRVGAVPKLPGGRACADLVRAPDPCAALDYTGVEFEAGEPLVLTHLAEYSDLEEPAEIDLAAVFRELGGSASLTFAVRTSDPTVTAAALAGMVLRIVPMGPGTATVTVTATTADGRTETRVFDTTVPGATRLRGWRWKLLEGS